MRKTYILLAPVLILIVVVGAFVAVVQVTRQSGPPKPQPVTQDTESGGNPRVAGAFVEANDDSPGTDAAAVKLVVRDGNKTKTIAYTPPKQPSSGGRQPNTPTPPPQDTPRIPEEITVNLSGPLTYTLQPGKQSPILTYELTDGIQREWYPGLSAGWIGDRDTTAPVWATVLEKPSGQPYINNYVHFVIHAQSFARPGVYKTSIKMVLKSGVVLGVPVMVTVPDVRAPSNVHTQTT